MKNNMRELKFRVWMKDWKRFLPEHCNEEYGLTLNGKLCESDCAFVVNQRDNYIIQQFTGLKDKNNKEIFEGDICYSDIFEQKYQILWNKAYSGWKFCAVLKHGGNLDFYGLIPDDSKVIGNIFENPDLLK